MHIRTGTIHIAPRTMHIRTGTTHIGSGISHIGTGTMHIRTGTTHIGSGISHIGTGTMHVRTGTTHIESGISHIGARIGRGGTGKFFLRPGTIVDRPGNRWRDREAVTRLDYAPGSPQYCHLMPRLPLPVRRCLAAFAALIVLLAPVTQLAHAQAMAHPAAACAHGEMAHGHAPASSRPSQQHSHGGACCDFCGACCATALALPTRAGLLAAPIAAACPADGAPSRTIRVVRLPHAFPFSLAPPLPTA